MSLLLDALKKTGEARQNGAPGNTSNLNTPEAARAAGHKLFAAKAAPTGGSIRLGIIPIALISGLLLAAIGGYYVWQETSVTPPMPQPRTAVAPITPPAAVLPMETKAAPTVVSMGDTHSANVAAVKPRSSQPKPQSKPQRRAAAEPAPGVMIGHGQTADTIYPALTAAYQSYRKGDFATAWQLYRTVLQQDGKNRDALLGMAAIAQQQGQDDSAVQYYGQVLTLDPRDPAAHAGLSSLTTGDAASTESRLKLLLIHRPDAAALHFALGNLYAAQSRWGEAQQSYFNATNREPDNAQYAFNLAVSLDHLGQNKLAAQHYQRTLALELDQKSGDQTGGDQAHGFDRAQISKRVEELAGMARSHP